MEYVDGGDLGSYIVSRNYIAESLAKNFLLQVCVTVFFFFFFLI